MKYLDKYLQAAHPVPGGRNGGACEKAGAENGCSVNRAFVPSRLSAARCMIC
jgi:hypothetical protein